MHHYFNSIEDTKGNALIGFFVRCVDASSGAAIALYADTSLTPILSVSGVANAAQVNSDGNVSFYIPLGTYHLDIYATDSTTFVRRIQNIPMVEDVLPPSAATLGLFTGASLLTIGSGTVLVQTTGYSTLDVGAAVYVYDAAVDSTYVAANPRTSFVSANGRGFRLSTDQDITPLMCGGTDATALAAAYTVKGAIRWEATTAPGFSNSAYYSSAQHLTNAATPGTWYSAGFAGNNATEALTAGIVVPASAANIQTSGFASYVRSDRASVGGGGDVGLFSYVISNATNGNVFTINTVANDSTGKTGQTLGNELDFNVSVPATTVNGVNAVIVSTLDAALTGTRIAYAARGSFHATSQWSHGYYTADGAIEQYAVFVGAASATTLTNRNSQPIALVSYKNDNTRYIATILGDSLGGLAIRAGNAGAAVAFQPPDGSVNWAAVSANGLGYVTGVGGVVTQATSKSTGVTLNKVSGQITLNGAALASAAKVSFVVTNSTVAATDTVIVSVASGGTANAYRAAVTAVAAGSFTLTVENITAGSLSEAPVVNFAVLKAVAA